MIRSVMPQNMPMLLSKSVQISYIDSDHTSNRLTYRSHTGIILDVQNTLIIWYSQRQNMVESSSFGSEFMALRKVTEIIEALQYELRMFSVPINGPAKLLCNNQSVVKNSSIPPHQYSTRNITQWSKPQNTFTHLHNYTNVSRKMCDA
jgi:hypothetical protein